MGKAFIMDLCFECGKIAECNHHVVPKSLGGKKTVSLCLVCHSKVHDRSFATHKSLQRIGIKKAQMKGKYKGRKAGSTVASPNRARQLRGRGLTDGEIAKLLGVTRRTVQRYVNSN